MDSSQLSFRDYYEDDHVLTPVQLPFSQLGPDDLMGSDAIVATPRRAFSPEVQGFALTPQRAFRPGAGEESLHTPSPPDRPRRCRLRSKQAPPDAYVRVASLEGGVENAPSPAVSDANLLDLPTYTGVWKNLHGEEFAAMTDVRAKYFAVYNRVRWWWKVLVPTLSAESQEPYVILFRKALADWKRLSPYDKSRAMSYVVRMTDPPEAVADYISKQWSFEDEKAVGYLCARSIMLTYQGDWGVVEPSATTSAQKKLSADEVVSLVKNSVACQKVWQELQDLVSDLVMLLAAEGWTAAMEFCEKTHTETSEVRLHAHVYLRASVGRRLKCCKATPFLFHGCLPHKSPMLDSKGNVQGFAGHYYLDAPKTSSIWVAHNKAPFVDYLVNPQWIWNLVQGGKMNYIKAKDQFVRCGRGANRNLQDLETWHSADQHRRLLDRMEEVRKMLLCAHRAFRHVPEVEAWRSFYCNGVHSRKKVLVLVGPSGLGKTSYTRSLFPEGSVLEINGANMQHVHLANFCVESVRCIFWDELPAALIVANKKLFQHPACLVDLGHSPTAQFVRHYWLADCVSVVASNTFRLELLSLSELDRAWLLSNTVVVDVTTPLFISSEDAASQSTGGVTALSP